MQFIDAVRAGDLHAFCEIERDCSEWWNVSIDRGAGAALHFAVDAGQVQNGSCLSGLMQGFTWSTLDLEGCR